MLIYCNADAPQRRCTVALIYRGADTLRQERKRPLVFGPEESGKNAGKNP